MLPSHRLFSSLSTQTSSEGRLEKEHSAECNEPESCASLRDLESFWKARYSIELDPRYVRDNNRDRVLNRHLDLLPIFLEVFDRLDHATLTGRLVYPVCHKFLVQWEEQKAFYPKAELWGQAL